MKLWYVTVWSYLYVQFARVKVLYVKFGCVKLWYVTVWSYLYVKFVRVKNCMLNLGVWSYGMWQCEREAAGVGGEGARNTESKTRTPHKLWGKTMKKPWKIREKSMNWKVHENSKNPEPDCFCHPSTPGDIRGNWENGWQICPISTSFIDFIDQQNFQAKTLPPTRPMSASLGYLWLKSSTT